MATEQMDSAKAGTLRTHFPGYYALSDADFKDLWAKCVFILDANVLLNLYRYPQKARDDLMSVLKRIKGRVWVPHQAAMEYQLNRLTVIADQKRRFAEVTKLVTGVVPYLTDRLEAMQLGKRHSTIDPSEFLRNVGVVVETFAKSLRALEKRQLDVHEKDPIRDELESLLQVGSGPATPKDMEDLTGDADMRNEAQMPPGLRDLKKNLTKTPSFTHAGIRYERKHGDLILWRQLLAHAKQANLTHVLFITDDDKDDWWLFSDSQGRKRIGARPELQDELGRETKVTLFHMYNSERFLEFAQQYLQIKIDQESIIQVKEVRESVSEAAEKDRADRALLRDAATRWLSTNYAPIELVEKEPFLHYIVEDPPGKKTGVFIRAFDIERGNAASLRTSIEVAEATCKKLGCTGTHIVIGVPASTKADAAKARVTPAIRNKGPNTRVTIGLINAAEDDAAEFDPIATF